MRSQAECIRRKYVKVEDIEGIIEREMKWRFNIEKNGGTLRQQTEYKATRFMSAIFVLALHDELSAIWKAIHDGELSLGDIFTEYERISKRVISKTV